MSKSFGKGMTVEDDERNDSLHVGIYVHLGQ